MSDGQTPDLPTPAPHESGRAHDQPEDRTDPPTGPHDATRRTPQRPGRTSEDAEDRAVEESQINEWFGGLPSETRQHFSQNEERQAALLEGIGLMRMNPQDPAVAAALGEYVKKNEQDPEIIRLVQNYRAHLEESTKPHQQAESDTPQDPEEERKQQEAKVDQTYNKSYTDNERELLEKFGLTERMKTSLRMQISPEQFDRAQIEEFHTALGESIEAHPELAEEFQKREKKIEEDAEKSKAESVQGEDAEERKRLAEESQKRAQEAIQDSLDHPLDIDKRKAADEAIAHAKTHHDQHEADHIGSGDPLWSKLLKYFGVGLYVYIGLQYLAAEAVENMAKGSGK